jgi:hypothetical protein
LNVADVEKEKEESKMAELKISRGVSKDEALNAIRCGVHDSMRELMGGGSGGSPGDNFYLAIKDGIREAVRAVARGSYTTTRDLTS